MILNIYKEKGWTSFDVVAKLRGVLGVKKVGHAGTLDPLAEGVLVVLTGEDTKKQEHIMRTKKEYLAEISFGATTETYDLEQKPVLSDKQISLEELKEKLPEVLHKYVGEFEQTVPPYSAKKVKGKVLYKQARKGKIDKSQLPIKRITIFDVETIGIFERDVITTTGNVKLSTVKLRITCSSGTYIRSLAHDLGKDLGVGGVLFYLVRTKVGKYTVEKSKKISELET